MKLLFYILLYVFLILSNVASAAPVGNICAPLLWGEGFLVRGGLYNITATIDFDRQKNILPRQENRVIWIDPLGVSDEERHYEQLRSSKNEYVTSGITIGAVIQQTNMVYVMLGSVSSTVDLTYFDDTVHLEYSTKAHFESDNDIYYGIGWTGVMQEGVFMEETPVRLGMDVKYRKLEMEDNSLSSSGKFYSASLDEFQLGLVLSAEIENLYPYFGFRISSITGREHFIDKADVDADGFSIDPNYYENGYIDYRRDISWFKNTGYLAGVSYYFKELVIFNAEYRSGSEEGVGFSTTIKF